ncbi:hypothetical protein OSTOST_08859 [Ostertagia ostertagi]
MRATAESTEWARALLRTGEKGCEADEATLSCYRQRDLISDVSGETIAADDIENFAGKAMLSSENVHVAHMNDTALQRMPEHLELKVNNSIDEAENADPADVFSYQVEHLNSLSLSGMVPHELKLKQGCIVMLLCNQDVSKGLCDGTKFIAEQCGRYILGCRFATGSRRNKFVLIPRGYHFEFVNDNFPFASPLPPSSTKLKNRHYQKSRCIFSTTFFPWTALCCSFKGSRRRIGENSFINTQNQEHCPQKCSDCPKKSSDDEAGKICIKLRTVIILTPAPTSLAVRMKLGKVPPAI